MPYIFSASFVIGRSMKILSRIEAGEAKRSEKIGFSFSLEHAKTKRNGSFFASFRFEAKKIFKRNRRTLGASIFLWKNFCYEYFVTKASLFF
jgi:hypothetical protein